MAFEPAISLTTSNAYVTVEEIDVLLEGFDTEIQGRWDDLAKDDAPESDQQEAIILEATRLIDQYHGWGLRAVDGQRLSFPRSVDLKAAIPEGVKRAAAEYIAFRLDGQLIPIKTLQAERVTSASILGQTSSWEVDESGLPAGARKELNLLRDSRVTTKATKHRDDGTNLEDSFFG